MEPSTRFRINTPHVVHEPFEQEIVLVNLETGRYYCLVDSGADIWRLLMEGRSLAETAAALTGVYSAAADALLDASTTLAGDLVAQGLVVADGRVAAAPAAVAAPGGTTPKTFAPPVLQTYTDMQDLLLLDPIHEVDDAGWPVARKDPSTHAE